MKYIIVVGTDTAPGPQDYDPNPRFLFPDAREWSHPLTSEEPDSGRQGWERKVKVWECSDKEVKRAVEQLTKWHGDQEISVYKLDTVYYRVPGELSSKAVTKDGVLPF